MQNNSNVLTRSATAEHNSTHHIPAKKKVLWKQIINVAPLIAAAGPRPWCDNVNQVIII